MPKYVITIPVETEIDPSTLLDTVQNHFVEFISNYTSEECEVDEEEVCVANAD